MKNKSSYLSRYQVEIMCIGIDGLKHICYPEKDTTKCGVKIARKKMGKKDWERKGCYECTY